jgi:WD40 repeat protein/tRNA A-37 threonylcarbamoyl transferase component Bud32
MPINVSTEPGDSFDREAVLGEAVAAYLRSREIGQPISPETLLADHPELAEELTEFLASHERIERLTQPLRTLTSAAEPPAQAGVKVRYFGDYELLDQIAQGGMGVVYKARQISLNRVVAVKMIRSGLLATEADVKRFAAEAEAAANLRHPGIVAIYEVGVHDGQHYYSMEYVEGRDLSQIVRDNPLSHDKSAEYMRQMAEIVEYSHSQGVLHRDLKPANVLIDATDRVRITDFGLAKRLGSDSDLTTSGQVIGTPRYMSPEQAAAQHALIGPASDVYALGSILYELLTGRAPFRSDSAVDILRQIQQEDPVRPKLLNSRLPKDLETICLRCLEKEPRRRYATAQDLADELGRLLRGEPIRARPIGRPARAWRWCKRKPIAASLLVSLVVGTVATTWQAIRATLAEKATLLALADVSAENIRANENEAKAIGLAEKEFALRERVQLEAARLMFEQGWSKYEHGDIPYAILLMVRSLTDLESLNRADRVVETSASREKQLLADAIRSHLLDISLRLECPRTSFAHDESVNVVVFSPDGKKMATASDDGTARLWDVATGALLATLPHKGPVKVAVFSPDGAKLATGDANVQIWDVATANRHGDALRSGGLRSLAFSPNGTKLCTVSGDGAARLWDVNTCQPLGDALPHMDIVWAAAFSPDSTKLATASLNKTVQIWDVATRKPQGVAFEHTGAVMAVEFSPDGAILATGSSESAAPRFWNVTTGLALGDAVHETGRIMHMAFNIDGSKLSTFAVSDNACVARLWDVSSGNPTTKALEIVGADTYARFSPDGTELAVGISNGVRLWDLETGNPIGNALSHRGRVYAVAFGPDGSKLATASADHTARLWDVASGTPLRAVFEHANSVNSMAFSPDGTKLATGSFDTTACVWNLANGTQKLNTLSHAGDVYAVAFTPDGKLATLAADRGDATVQLWDADTGKHLAQTLRHIGGVHGRAFSPDGAKLATTSGINTRLWDVATGKRFGDVLQPTGACAAFSVDGTKLVTGTPGNTAQIWEVTSGKPLGRALKHTSLVLSVAFSPNGEILATGTPHAAYLWDVRAGAVIGDSLKHSGGIWAVAFSADGKIVATGSSDHTARLWTVATRKPLGDTLQHSSGVRALAFNPNGTTVVTASDDHTARIWDVPGTSSEPSEQLYLWAEALIGAAVNGSGTLRQLSADELISKKALLQGAGGPPRAYLEALEKRRQNRSTS